MARKKKKKKNKKRRKKKKKKAASLQIVHMHTQLIPSFGLRPTFPKILKITPWALFSNGADSPCNVVVLSDTFFDISPTTVWRLLRALHAHGMFEFLAAASRPPATASQLRTSRHRSLPHTARRTFSGCEIRQPHTRPHCSTPRTIREHN